MAGEEANVAVAAMVVALVALLVASGQLLQALFGTAVGYRHCQRSVIGGWVKWRSLKWHWRELRFETRFRTPHMSLEAVRQPLVPPGFQYYRNGLSFITGTSTSRFDTCVYKHDFLRDEEFLVGWLRLLEQLHVTMDECLCDYVSGDELKGEMDNRSQPPTQGREQAARSARAMYMRSKSGLDNAHHTDYTRNAFHNPRSQLTSPAIIYRRRSWDFMPPEIIRPFASSNVGDIIAIAHRLGMGWIDLRPEEGSMRAEGHGRTFTSTTVRGLGILLQFNCNYHVSHKKYEVWRDFTIPCQEADALGFGIIEICRNYLPLPDLILDDEGDCVRTILGTLGIRWEVIDRFCNSVPQRGLQGLGDLISLAAPFMPIEGLRVRKIMKIHRDFCPSHFSCWEGFHVFELRLEKLYQKGECSEHMAWLRAEFRRMKDTWKRRWTDQEQNPDHGNDLPLGYLDELQALWRETTEFLRYTCEGQGYSLLRSLIAAHISQAIENPDMVDEADRDEEKRKYFEEGLNKTRSRRTASRMHLYIDRIPMVVHFMKEKHNVDENLVVDAWWTLILRALCWHRAHYMIEGKTRGYGGIPVNSKFHNSKLPVYIV